MSKAGWRAKGKRLKGVKVDGVWTESIECKRITALRREMGLAPIINKIRNCLKCNSAFESSGVQNRMCSRCSYAAGKTAPDRGAILSRYG